MRLAQSSSAMPNCNEEYKMAPLDMNEGGKGTRTNTHKHTQRGEKEESEPPMCTRAAAVRTPAPSIKRREDEGRPLPADAYASRVTAHRFSRSKVDS